VLRCPGVRDGGRAGHDDLPVGKLDPDISADVHRACGWPGPYEQPVDQHEAVRVQRGDHAADRPAEAGQRMGWLL